MQDREKNYRDPYTGRLLRVNPLNKKDMDKFEMDEYMLDEKE